jgi:hypothetical protein
MLVKPGLPILIPKLRDLHLHLRASHFNYSLFANMVQSRQEASELLQVTLEFIQLGLDEDTKYALRHVSSQGRTVIIIDWAVENQRWCKEKLYGGKVYTY